MSTVVGAADGEPTMRVHLITFNYLPEGNAAVARASALAASWTASGHEVKVVTAFPHFPEGRLFPGYRNACFRADRLDGIPVLRCWVWPQPNRARWQSAVSHLSHTASALLFAARHSGPCDVVVASSPPLFVGLTGWLYSRVKRARFVFEARDLWPASLQALGALKDGLVLRSLERVERHVYDRADRVVCVTEGTRSLLVARGLAEEKLAVVPNGAGRDFLEATLADRERVRRACGLRDEFVVGYLGTHGVSQGLDTLLDVAERLRAWDQVRFLLCGAGSQRARLVSRATQRHLTNVIFLERRPYRDMPALYAAVDACWVSLVDVDLFATVVPSKIFEAMASARPIIGCLQGEAATLVEEHRCGLCVPRDPEAIAEAVLALARSPQRRMELGVAGRAAARSHFIREQTAIAYLNLLREVVAGSTTGADNTWAEGAANEVRPAEGVLASAGAAACTNQRVPPDDR
jgi:glycosyltransferase involved in cell wall biosynthesis